MGRSKNAIYLRARKLNIDLILDRKAWSKKDDEYLSDNWGKKQIETIAKNLNRSVYAVKIHASRTGLGPMADANISEISLKTLSEIFAVHPTTISRTWKSKGLNLKKKKRTNNSFYYCVKLKDLMNFLEKNQNLFDSRYLEKNILGVEPEWLEEKRISDEKTNIYKYRVWTKEEIILAEKMLLSGSNYKEISLKINRSRESIRVKLNQLGLAYRLSRFWKGHELEYLKENYRKIPVNKISYQLKRTKKAIIFKAQQL